MLVAGNSCVSLEGSGAANERSAAYSRWKSTGRKFALASRRNVRRSNTWLNDAPSDADWPEEAKYQSGLARKITKAWDCGACMDA